MFDTGEIEALFAETLIGAYDDDAPWHAVNQLRDKGTRKVFDIAAAWCADASALRRARGADILAMLGVSVGSSGHPFPQEAVAVIANMARKEREVLPLSAALQALAHLADPAAVPIALDYARHEREEVRFAATFVFGALSDRADCQARLVELSRDSDEDIRNWAVFFLGEQDKADSPEIREALVARIADENVEVRWEAVVGLGCKKDRRAVPFLIPLLMEEDPAVSVVEAACALLGLAAEPEGWSGFDYAAALGKTFPAE